MAEREPNREMLAHKALIGLPRGNRLVLIMRYVDGLTAEEIAEVLLTSEGGIDAGSREKIKRDPVRAVESALKVCRWVVQAAVLGKVIGPKCPRDGRQWEGQCARCGSSMTHEECNECCGEGYVEEENEYDEEVAETCHTCGGSGGWWVCLSSSEWCEANPLKGREKFKRGTIEWFVVEER